MGNRVFIDRNIFALGVIIEGAVETQEVQWGGVKQELNIHGWRRKRLRDKNLRIQIECLPSIARLIREGSIEPYTSMEIELEGFSASIGMRGTRGDIFANIIMPLVPIYVDRSFFGGLSSDQCVSRKDVIDFCKFLISLNPSDLERRVTLWERFPNGMKKGIKEINRFKDICGALTVEKHFPDALHLWTAEINDAEFFLTADGKFIRALTQSSRLALPTKPVLPQDLLKEIGVTQRDPLPVEDFEFHSLCEL